MIVIEAPHPINIQGSCVSIFLAGSIEMGTAEQWQDKIIDALKEKDVVLLNPRRKDWDSTWIQNYSCPEFVEQVNWELKGLEKADLIIFYFDPNTKSPITLLELGLFARDKSKRIVVVCSPELWRSGNIQIVCQRYDLTLLSSFSALVGTLKYALPDVIV